MAKVIGGITTSHIPAIGAAMAKGVTQEPYWKRFFDGYNPVKEWIQENKPDVTLVVYNDHGLNFFLNHVSTFALGAADQYKTADEGWGLTNLPTFKGDAALSWHLVESLIEQDFDMATCQEMLMDHGCVVPMSLLYGPDSDFPTTLVPLAVNTVQHPVTTARRCYALGKALRKAIDSYDEDLTVAIVGTGGMSHQLQGERAGIIDTDFDILCMEKIINDPQWLTQMSNAEIMEKAGTEGIETIMWLVMRGAMDDNVKVVHKHYHAPISNTGAGVLILENAMPELPFEY